MRSDGAEVTLHQFNNNTWGLGFNRSGDTFGSTANNNPLFSVPFRPPLTVKLEASLPR